MTAHHDSGIKKGRSIVHRRICRGSIKNWLNAAMSPRACMYGTSIQWYTATLKKVRLLWRRHARTLSIVGTVPRPSEARYFEKLRKARELPHSPVSSITIAQAWAFMRLIIRTARRAWILVLQKAKVMTGWTDYQAPATSSAVFGVPKDFKMRVPDVRISPTLWNYAGRTKFDLIAKSSKVNRAQTWRGFRAYTALA